MDVDETEPADGPAPWRDPAWLADAGAWISEACDAAGLERTGPGRADPEVRRLREVYLEPWSAEGLLTPAQLDRAVALALGLTMVMRAHTWTRLLPAFRSNPRPWTNVAAWLGRIGCEDPVTVGLS